MDSEKLFYDFLRLDHQIDEFYHDLAARQGLSDSAFCTLWSVAELGEGCTQKDVCSQFSLSKQTVHSAVRKLEQEGTLSLRPGAGREVSIFLTEQGRELVRTKITPAMEAERNAAKGLDPEEWRTLLRLTEKWFAAFQEEAASIPRTQTDGKP